MNQYSKLILKFLLINFSFFYITYAGNHPSSGLTEEQKKILDRISASSKMKLPGRVILSVATVMAWPRGSKVSPEIKALVNETTVDLGVAGKYLARDVYERGYDLALEYPECAGAVSALFAAGATRYLGGSRRDMVFMGGACGAGTVLAAQEAQKKRLHSDVRFGVTQNLKATTDQRVEAEKIARESDAVLGLSEEGRKESQRVEGCIDGLHTCSKALLEQTVRLQEKQADASKKAMVLHADSADVHAGAAGLGKKVLGGYEQAGQISSEHDVAVEARRSGHLAFLLGLGEHADSTRKLAEDSAKIAQSLSGASVDLARMDTDVQALRSDASCIAELSNKNLRLMKQLAEKKK